MSSVIGVDGGGRSGMKTLKLMREDYIYINKKNERNGIRSNSFRKVKPDVIKRVPEENG